MKPVFYANNRRQLAKLLKGGLVVVSAYSKMQRTNDEAFKFEQESNFLYLTGIPEPDWWMIYDGSRDKCWLVKPNADSRLEIFNGSIDDTQALKTSGADEIITRDDCLTLLRQLKRSHNLVHTVRQPEGIERYHFVINPALSKVYDLLDRNFENVQDCRKQLAALRAIKQPEEITQIKKAITITRETLQVIESRLVDYQYEYQVEADITREFIHAGAHHGFEPIVAGGKNACTLHYHKNNTKLRKQNLLLVDVGAKVGHYSADLTRTFAVGKPKERALQIHNAVVAAQKSIIKKLRPTLSLIDLQHIVESVMLQQIEKLGLVKDDPMTDLHRYFPHAIGHGLGIDLHESLAHETLQEGMIITIEPGIYIPEEGIGVRIEDDILITNKGVVNLSTKLSTDLVY